MTEATKNEQIPWLEHFPEGSRTVQRTTLDQGTITLGRADTADLQIDSTRVSREHAQVQVQDGVYFIQDLGSTNGTQVNGEVINRVQLANGDVIVIADTEFTFLTCSTSQLRNMATQPLMQQAARESKKETSSSNQQQAYDAILNLRRTHENVLQQFAPVHLKTVIELPEQNIFACFLGPSTHDIPPDEITSKFLRPPTHTLMREREVRRRAATQQSTSQIGCERLIATFEPWEIHENPQLLWHFAALRESLPGTSPLWAGILASDVVDLPEDAQFCQELQRLEIEIACYGFVGSESQVRELEELDPEILFLAPELTNDGLINSRQVDRLQAIYSACNELRISPVVSEARDEETMCTCLKLGYRLYVQDQILKLPAYQNSSNQDEKILVPS